MSVLFRCYKVDEPTRTRLFDGINRFYDRQSSVAGMGFRFEVGDPRTVVSMHRDGFAAGVRIGHRYSRPPIWIPDSSVGASGDSPVLWSSDATASKNVVPFPDTRRAWSTSNCRATESVSMSVGFERGDVCSRPNISARRLRLVRTKLSAEGSHLPCQNLDPRP